MQAEKDEQDRLQRERKEEERKRLELKVRRPHSPLGIEEGTRAYCGMLCCHGCILPSKDLERREDELIELRHRLEDNQTAVLKWKKDAVEKAQVCENMNAFLLLLRASIVFPKQTMQQYIYHSKPNNILYLCSNSDRIKKDFRPILTCVMLSVSSGRDT